MLESTLLESNYLKSNSGFPTHITLGKLFNSYYSTKHNVYNSIISLFLFELCHYLLNFVSLGQTSHINYHKMSV